VPETETNGLSRRSEPAVGDNPLCQPCVLGKQNLARNKPRMNPFQMRQIR
jgi:hypothetical protein